MWSLVCRGQSRIEGTSTRVARVHLRGGAAPRLRAHGTTSQAKQRALRDKLAYFAPNKRLVCPRQSSARDWRERVLSDPRTKV